MDALEPLLTPLAPRPADPALLARAAAPGPLRDAGVAVAADPSRPPRASLHSRERRLLREARFDLARDVAVIDAVLGTSSPEARWDRWLAHRGHGDGDGDVRDLADDVRPHLDGTLQQAVTLLGGFDPDVARELVRSLGDDVVAFLAASREPGPVVLRVNRAKASREGLAARLAQQKVRTRPGRWSADALIVDGYRPLEGLAAWRDGWFEVQDEGSQLVAGLVPTGPVVDLCAGAGGKSLQLAARGERVIATDVRRDALEALAERAGRAGAGIEIVEPGGELPVVPAVLVDAPCTGTGRLRREPWLRQRLRADVVALRTGQQAAILDRAAALVAAGGTLVYATCSVLRAENDDQVEAFLVRHPGFQAVGEPLRVAPHSHGTDGFFAVRLDRTD